MKTQETTNKEYNTLQSYPQKHGEIKIPRQTQAEGLDNHMRNAKRSSLSRNRRLLINNENKNTKSIEKYKCS